MTSGSTRVLAGLLAAVAAEVHVVVPPLSVVVTGDELLAVQRDGAVAWRFQRRVDLATAGDELMQLEREQGAALRVAGHRRQERARHEGRNGHWRHLYNSEILSVPDKWEYPWYAAWDLAFHCVPLALVPAGKDAWLAPRYLPGVALQNALIYIVGGSDNGMGGATTSVEWMIW